jgi:hypothetical protein
MCQEDGTGMTLKVAQGYTFEYLLRRRPQIFNHDSRCYLPEFGENIISELDPQIGVGGK